MNLSLFLYGNKSKWSDKASENAKIEAQRLVQRCAEPRPVGDSAKVAINRAAQRLGFSYSRTRDLWYGNARRIDSQEMDALRVCAERTEIITAVANLQVLRNRLSQMASPAADKAVGGIDAALRTLGRQHRRNRSLTDDGRS